MRNLIFAYIFVLVSCNTSSVKDNNINYTTSHASETKNGQTTQTSNNENKTETELAIVSGLYSDGWDLKLAINPKNHIVYGKFKAQQIRDNTTYFCDEYLIGYKDQDTLRLTRISNLQNFDQYDTLNEFNDKMYLGEDHWGDYGVMRWKVPEHSLDAHCWRVIPSTQNKEGMSMSIENASTKPWREIQIVKEKTYFFTDTLDTNPRKAFIVQNDAFCVISNIGNWYFGEYVGEKQTTKGWLRKKDFYVMPYIKW